MKFGIKEVVKKILCLKLVRFFLTLFHKLGATYVSVGDTNYSLIRLGWETVDIVDADYICDFRSEPLPFTDNSIDIINSSHVIEHLPLESALHFYNECYRVLKPGGIFRISTPDASLLVQHYLAEDVTFFMEADGSYIFSRIKQGDLPPEALLLHNRLMGWLASYSGRVDSAGGPLVSKHELDEKIKTLSIEGLCEWAVSKLEEDRSYAHVNVYTKERLIRELTSVGFKRIQVSSYRESLSSVIRRDKIDKPKHRSYSVYLDVVKD